VDVSDVRQAHQKFTLDRNGFEYHHLRSELKYEDFFDNDKIASVYLKELRELVKTVCMAKQAVPLDAEVSLSYTVLPPELAKTNEVRFVDVMQIFPLRPGKSTNSHSRAFSRT
jgi:hypothetical protein